MAPGRSEGSRGHRSRLRRGRLHQGNGSGQGRAPRRRLKTAAGALRVLAVGSLRRRPGLPQIPTVAESGFPGYRSDTIQALFTPAGAPEAVVRRLHAEFRRILQGSEVRQQAGSLGF
ncbi:tripartite tricarboxylate transporter substrate-binding protein [Cupriavidus sp. BIC8F]|uniref:tripartite tricarboxylate transporter substrate-binding protein n=1 Tax=Cupriavidus sp. BIC8F TaxID=3079014 RepID=UPI0029161F03|nr:tripartite tricarboxylate transporter substrate-binding protein [Cupriavidus sp. BIC8F]